MGFNSAFKGLIVLETAIVEKTPKEKTPKCKSYRIENQFVLGFRKLRVVC